VAIFFLGQSMGIDENNTFHLKFVLNNTCRVQYTHARIKVLAVRCLLFACI